MQAVQQRVQIGERNHIASDHVHKDKGMKRNAEVSENPFKSIANPKNNKSQKNKKNDDTLLINFDPIETTSQVDLETIKPGSSKNLNMTT